MEFDYVIYTDGACLGNPGPGGWAAIIFYKKKKKKLIKGNKLNTTNNQMELLASIEALKDIENKSSIKIYTDSKYLIDGINNIDPKALEGVTAVGITAGASAPEEIVQEVIDYLASYDFKKVRDLSQNKENLTFKLPKELSVL